MTFFNACVGKSRYLFDFNALTGRLCDFFQAFGGLYAFLFPGIQANSRATLMPYHRFAGLVLLALSIVAAVSGINEKAIFKL